MTRCLQMQREELGMDEYEDGGEAVIAALREGPALVVVMDGTETFDAGTVTIEYA